MPDVPICIKCLDELRRQQVIDEKMYDHKITLCRVEGLHVLNGTYTLNT